MPVSVFLADDHARFRGAVRNVIAATPDFALAGEVSSGEQAVTLVPQLAPDLVLMDVQMAGMSGFEAAAILASTCPGLLIVLMSAGPIECDAFWYADTQFVTLPKEELCPRRLLDLWQRPRGRRQARRPQLS